jgi:hypothetical protein
MCSLAIFFWCSQQKFCNKRAREREKSAQKERERAYKKEKNNNFILPLLLLFLRTMSRLYLLLISHRGSNTQKNETKKKRKEREREGNSRNLFMWLLLPDFYCIYIHTFLCHWPSFSPVSQIANALLSSPLSLSYFCLTRTKICTYAQPPEIERVCVMWCVKQQ